jgi:Concanavalin A-like lectin/glucanases superfamily
MRPETSLLLFLVVLFLGRQRLCHGHTYGYHGLTGIDPPNAPNLPEITGPFEVEAVIRLDDNEKEHDRVVFQYSTVDSNGSVHDVIAMEITSNNKADIQLSMQPRGGVLCTVKAVNAVVIFEVATFSAGVQANGTAWIAKNGLVYARTSCPVPGSTVVRNTKLVGRNQFNSEDRFRGAILGLRIKNLNSPNIIVEQTYQSLPGQIFDQGFTVSFWARFDENTGRTRQKIFDFCTSINQDKISFGQKDGDTDKVEVTICRGTSCRSDDTTVPGLMGTWAFWHVGITKSGSTTGTVFIQRNGVTLDSNTDEPLPNKVLRPKLLIGKSCDAADSTFWGAILGLRVDIHDAS